MERLKSSGGWIKRGQTIENNGENVSLERRQYLNMLRHCCFDLKAKTLPLFNYWKPQNADDKLKYARLQKLAEAFHKQVFLGYTCVQFQESVETRTVNLFTVEGII